MTDNKKDSNTGACPVDKKDGKNKLVKSTELPLLGNPYPPKDVIENETPSSLELTVRSIRTTLQPYMSPICSAYNRTNDFISVGVAHSQGAIANLRENSSGMTGALVVSGAGILGWALARRRGIFKKLLFASILAGGTAGICYPKETKEKVDIVWLIAKNKLPSLLSEQYGNLMKAKPATTSDGAEGNKSGETKTSSN